MNNITIGYLFLILAQVAVSCNVVMGKYLGQLMPVYTYVGCRFLFSSILLGIIKQSCKIPLISKHNTEQKLTRKDWLNLALQALSAGFLFNFLFFIGVQHTTATSAGVIASTLPAVLTIMAWLILRERIHSNKIIAILLCIAGILTLSLDNTSGQAQESGSYLGDTIVFLAMIPEAWYSILSRQLKGRVTSLGSSFVVNVFSFLMMLPFMVQGMIESPPTTWSSQCYWILLAGGVFSACFFVLWSKGLEVVQASTAAIFGGIVPVATALLAILFLGESPSLLTFMGMGMVILSLWVGSYRSRKQKSLTIKA